MPYLSTAQSWLTQSTLLLQARPTTTRITTKYTISPPSTSSKSKSKSKLSAASSTAAPAAATPDTAAPRATLTLKTYDPKSGTTLKYETNKAAEVSRLIQILGRLARPMAGLEEVKEEANVGGGNGEGEGGEGVEVKVEAQVPAAKAGGQQGGQQQSGKGKGKKKGKK